MPCSRAHRVGIERGERGDWQCSRAVDPAHELDCRSGESELQVLERSPVPASRHGGLVTLANWSFRLHDRSLQGRSGIGPWHLLSRRPPFCVPAAPREVLVALPLQQTTPNSGCFVPRR